MSKKLIISPKINSFDALYLILWTSSFFIFAGGLFILFGSLDWQELLLMIAGNLIFLVFFLYQLSHFLLRRLIITEKWFTDCSGLPVGNRRIAIDTITDCRVQADLIVAWSHLRTLVLIGKKREIVEEIDVSKFDATDIKQLVSILKGRPFARLKGSQST